MSAAHPSLAMQSGSGPQRLRVVVVQIGSRRNYAVPIALEQAGLLERFYTDWYAAKGLATWAAARLAQWLPAKALARAAGRHAGEISLAKVAHFPGFALQYKWHKYRAARRGALPRAYVWGGRQFCKLVVESGLPACQAVFCFSSVAKEVFERLRGTGANRVLDQGIPPLAYEDRLVREQEAAYADWARPRPPVAGVEEYAERQREEWALADVILCPSGFCRNALSVEGAPLEKVRLLPFGIHPRFFSTKKNRGSIGNSALRVLFAGNTPIRKGLPDLVLALERLASSRVEAVFAGETSTLTPYGLHRASRVGSLLGNIPRTTMQDQYLQADVFALPTVSDVFPAVVLEAMAAGLPVITTPNCGCADVVRDGVDGFIVPIRAPDRIAEKLELLATNPALRAEMGHNAAERAKEYTLEKYRERLVAVLAAIVPNGDPLA